MKSFILSFCALTCVVLPPTRIAVGAESPRQLFLREAFYDIAFKCDCYFTIECFEEDQVDAVSALFNKKVMLTRCHSVKDAIAILQKELPEFNIRRLSPGSAVVCLIDSRLEKIKKYALRDIASLSYSGSAQEFVSYIGAKLDGRLISPKGSLVGLGPSICDGKTQFRIPRRRSYVRNLLTDYIPLSRYSRVIWTARSHTTADGFLVSEVHYNGQRYGSFQSSRKHPVDYKFGEEALEVNLKRLSRIGQNKEAIDSATRFITTKIDDSKSTQIRWAMFYLGECRSSTNVSLLVKHIDYHYTSSQLLEEAYPAIHALRRIGPPASTTALKQLATEPSALRRRLLCYSVLCVNGAAKGKKLIDEVLTEVKDETRVQRIRTAFTQAQTLYENAPIIAGEDESSR